MAILYEEINTALNRIHEWGEFDQHPLKRIFLTRIGSLGCAVLEAVATGYAAVQTGYTLLLQGQKLGSKAVQWLFPTSKSGLAQASAQVPWKSKLQGLADRLVGLLSTIFLGIFSPELNFRVHKKLGTAIDNLSEQKAKQLRIRLETELKAAEIKRERLERFTKLQEERDAAEEAKRREQRIDSRLAELL